MMHHNENGRAYGYFLRSVNIRVADEPISVVVGNKSLSTIACIKKATTGFEMHIFLEPFIQADRGMDAFGEIIKHEILHVVNGHLSSGFNNNLRSIYPGYVVAIAKDIVVNSNVNCCLIEKVLGISGYTADYFKFGRNKSTAHYCELLTEFFDNNPQEKEKMQGFVEIDVELDEEHEDMLKEIITRTKCAAGCDPSGWDSVDAENFIKAYDRPAVMDWQSILHYKEGKHRSCVKVPTKHRPSRRSPQHLGRRRAYQLDMLVAIDTSASMTDKNLAVIDAELRAIHKRGAYIMIVHADCDILRTEEYRPNVSLEKFFGGGCTDFDPVFKHAINMRPQPKLIVYFTDGDGVKLVEDPHIDTVWVLTPDSISVDEFKSRICDWGCIVKMKE